MTSPDPAAEAKATADLARNEALSYYNTNSARISEEAIRSIEAAHNLLARFDRQVGRSAQHPVKVLFLLPDISLWDVYSPIYRLMKASPLFEPRVIAFDRVDVAQDKTSGVVEGFFTEDGIDGEFSGAGGNPLKPIAAYEPDVVFYTLGSVAYPEQYRIEYVSRFCRTCYIAYGFLMADALDYQFGQSFHHAAWKVFAATPREVEEYSRRSKRLVPNVELTGYPKFDLFRDADLTETDPKTVVWAPHWTIGMVYPTLNFGTFPEIFSGMLELMRSMQDLRFVFRPHPNLRHACASTGFMNAEQYDYYMDFMKGLGNVDIYSEGDNISLFCRSSAMITDSISFLAEYVPTGRPLLFMDRPDRAKLAPVGEELIAAHYRGQTVADIESFLVERVRGQTDPRRAVRLEAGRRLLNIGPEPASAAILRTIATAFDLR